MSDSRFARARSRLLDPWLTVDTRIVGPALPGKFGARCFPLAAIDPFEYREGDIINVAGLDGVMRRVRVDHVHPDGRLDITTIKETPMDPTPAPPIVRSIDVHIDGSMLRVDHGPLITGLEGQAEGTLWQCLYEAGRIVDPSTRTQPLNEARRDLLRAYFAEAEEALEVLDALRPTTEDTCS